MAVSPTFLHAFLGDVLILRRGRHFVDNRNKRIAHRMMRKSAVRYDKLWD